MIKQLITEFPLSDVPRERSISREKITKYAYTKDEVDALIDAAVDRAREVGSDTVKNVGKKKKKIDEAKKLNIKIVLEKEWNKILNS